MRELSLHILDLLENALEAGATQVELHIDEDLQADRLAITVRDNGRGMDGGTVQQVLDPFFTTRTTRHVGLGLPLFAAAARRCAGDLIVDSAPGQGTTVSTTFQHSHLDRAPLGDISGTLLAFLLHQGDAAPRLCYHHRVDDAEFYLDTAAIQAELGGIPLSYPTVWAWLHEYIREGERELEGGNNAKAQDD